MIVVDAELPPAVAAWAYDLHRNVTLDESGVTMARFQVEDRYYTVWIQKHNNKEAQLAAIPPG